MDLNHDGVLQFDEFKVGSKLFSEMKMKVSFLKCILRHSQMPLGVINPENKFLEQEKYVSQSAVRGCSLIKCVI